MARSSLTALPLALVMVACASDTDTLRPDVDAYVGARAILGDGSVIEDAVLVVEDGRYTAVGTRDEVEVPGGARTTDLTGRTVMPTLVNAHAHLNTDPEARAAQLQEMAYYGAGLVVSLGHDDTPAAYAVRDEGVAGGARSLTAGRGITMPEPGRSEAPYWITDEASARAAVVELAEAGADIVKIWVDDRGGQYEKLTPELYAAVIDEAHQHGLKVTAHIFALEDAKGLLRAGIDAFAHGVRDQDVDDELVQLWADRPEVVLVPNLPSPGVAEDLSWLAGTVPATPLAELQERAVDRPAAQESFGIQARNLVRLHQAGVPVAFGTDGGNPWAVHQELADMVRAGMSTSDVLVAATRTSALLMGADDTGLIAPGLRADFMVLDQDPLADIANTRSVSAVYLAGEPVDREGISARALGTGTGS